ncbi:MAG: alanine racemase [Acidimicrobiia bacterium]
MSPTGVHPDDRPYAWADVDLGAIRDNAALLRKKSGTAALCAVVKGWGYGHGIIRAAAAAVEGGATWLGVALVNEAAELRRQGRRREPVLVMAEPPHRQMRDLASLIGVRPTVYTAEGVAAAAAAARQSGRSGPLPVHLKIDTGMHRVGASPEAARHLAELIVACPELELEGVWTHLAAADDPGHDDFTTEQLARFDGARRALADIGIRPAIVHAANSAALLAHPESHFDLVRAGIALYGLSPRSQMPEAEGLRPAMTLRARVAHVKRVEAGETVSYGRHHRCPVPTIIATVPIGYYDGVPRRLGLVGGEVLVGGRRRPIVGAVTMDQLMIDCGAEGEVRVRDEVVLFGEQGDDAISAWDWADRLDTIAYEVVCSVSINRVPRRYRG